MPSTAPDRIGFVASSSDEAQAALRELTNRYGTNDPEEAEVIVALGGDGLMLATLHRFMTAGKPIYGMNCGSVGFLMNEYRVDGLLERINAAETSIIHPLLMRAADSKGFVHKAHAINEVSMLRQSYQAAKLRLSIDGKVRMEELICDGILVSTPAGSTAYNLSAHGPILPLNSPLLALTPISAFRPRRWRGALLPQGAKVSITVLEPEKRPVNAVADHFEVRSVLAVEVGLDRTLEMRMLHDPGHGLDERILREQFGD